MHHCAFLDPSSCRDLMTAGLAKAAPLLLISKKELTMISRTIRDLKISKDGNQELLCPDCGNNYMHHLEIHVTTRDGEDQGGTIATIAQDGSTSLRRVGATQIPGRRDSLQISFWCEACGEDAPQKILQILQHKGNTEIGWLSPTP